MITTTWFCGRTKSKTHENQKDTNHTLISFATEQLIIVIEITRVHLYCALKGNA